MSSVPVGVLGILFEKPLSALFAVPLYAGIFLIGNGALLYGIELLIRKRPKYETHSYERVVRMTWVDAISVGLLPMFSTAPRFLAHRRNARRRALDRALAPRCSSVRVLAPRRRSSSPPQFSKSPN